MQGSGEEYAKQEDHTCKCYYAEPCLAHSGCCIEKRMWWTDIEAWKPDRAVAITQKRSDGSLDLLQDTPPILANDVRHQQEMWGFRKGEGGVVQRLGKSSVEGETVGTIGEFPANQRLAGCAGRLAALASFLPHTPPLNARRFLTPPPRRRPRCTPEAAMADVSERTLQLSVLVAFASGILLGWQANRLRRRYLDWRKRRLQDKLAATQKKLDLA
ncbi:LOW QUALITY PROTEIN: mitoregulin [Hylobates moloch]|uniref:LOW QUALITY PROTEIN: mitoregulin n=1 Tax=Hylobates moloch TaxID=81572 RepID=UPI00267734A3|nr:LOW QUALITY PROTEIN: mitoregulin [Hylobates moloch]